MKTAMIRSWRSIASALLLLGVANACSSGTISGGDNTKPVAGLRFSVQPAASSGAGAVFNVTVELLDASGAKITKATDVVTLSVTGGATLTGTTSAAAVAGVATFTGLSVTKAGTGYTITASANGISASSSSFTVTTAAVNAAQSGVTFTPTSITTGATIAFTFTFKDQYGNPIANKSVTLASSLAGVTFTPSTGTTSATGTFTTNMVATTAGSTTLTATVDGTQITVGTPIAIAPPTTFTIATSSNPANGGTTTGGGTVTQGASVTVVATAASGFFFSSWTEGTTTVSTNASYTFTASANRTLVANFSALNSGDCTPVAMTFPGAASGTIPAAGSCVANGLSAANYRFTLAAAGGVNLNLSSTFSAVLEIKTDPTPGENIGFIGTSPITVEWLLPAGTYQARVSAQTGTGTFTLTSTSVTGASNVKSGCSAGVPLRALLVGGTFTGQSLGSTANDCSLSDNSLVDWFYIRSLKPCTITMTPTTGNLNPFILIADAALSQLLATKNDNGANLAETLSLNGCNNGGAPIAIGMNTLNAGEAGGYTMTVTLTGGGSIVSGVSPTVSPNVALPVVDIGNVFQKLIVRK